MCPKPALAVTVAFARSLVSDPDLRRSYTSVIIQNRSIELLEPSDIAPADYKKIAVTAAARFIVPLLTDDQPALLDQALPPAEMAYPTDDTPERPE